MVLASGSHDQCVNVWSAKDGSLLKSYPSTGGVFQVRWCEKGDRLAACYSDSTV